MVAEAIAIIFSSIQDFFTMIYEDFFEPIGVVPWIVTFGILGIFISFVILHLGTSVTSSGGSGSDRARPRNNKPRPTGVSLMTWNGDTSLAVRKEK